MTSYEFEVAAKNAVIEVCKSKYNEDYTISDIQAVWFSHLLGMKKTILIDIGQNNRMYEVTYNYPKNEMYVDVYEKKYNIIFDDDNINTNVHIDDPSKEVILRELERLSGSEVLSSKASSLIDRAITLVRSSK